MDNPTSLTVSVIIPVYNAEEFLRQAVESVVAERAYGVKEIILVEDGSPDNSLADARQLLQYYPDLLQLYQHPGGENRGAGASRNLGIKKATGDLICFLDADDYWLPGRLDEAIKILSTNADVDGVYDSARFKFEIEEEKLRFVHSAQVLGANKIVAPEDLFEELMSGTQMWCTNGITVRRSCFQKTGLFNENLRRAQDMELFCRMAAVLRLVGSSSREPVAVIRRHGKNRWNPVPGLDLEQSKVGLNAFEAFHQWMKENLVDDRVKVAFLKRLIYYYGCFGRFGDAWQIACQYKRRWLIMYAWRYRIPGPKTMILLFAWLVAHLKKP